MELDTGRIIGVLVIAAILYLILERRRIFGAVRRARRRKELDQKAKDYSHKAAGDHPPMTVTDADDFKAWLAASTLPYAALTIGDKPAASPLASRIGGQPLLPAEAEWPVDLRNNTMVCLAQINFSELPPIPDFPDRGLLLIFVAANDLFGMNAGDEGDDIRVFYLTDPADGRLAPAPSPRDEDSPFTRPAVESEGRAISFGPLAYMTPWGSDWRIDERWPGWWARGGDTTFADGLDGADEQPSPEAYIGGNLRMIHSDPRAEQRWGDYDRVLLRIGSDRNIQWGDAGAACFLIRRADLLARDFTRVRFFWDSH
jgi:uncharacterized protein YwqG